MNASEAHASGALAGRVLGAVSGAVARSAQRFDFVRIAVAALGGAAALIAAAWLVAAAGDGAWVSVPLLVLFPILSLVSRGASPIAPQQVPPKSGFPG